MRVVGLDWAVSPSDRAAVVLEKIDEKPITVVDVVTPVDNATAAELCTSTDKIVVAVDIPFAWPREFSEFVSQWIPFSSDACKPPKKDFFQYRYTDRFVHDKTSKWPLSVSTNFFALGSLEWASIIHEKQLGSQIVVSRKSFSASKLPAIIEVYPGATLKAFENDDSLPISGTSSRTTVEGNKIIERKYSYKKDETTRGSLVEAVISAFQIHCDDAIVQRIVSTEQKDHASDGLLSALTALIFMDVVNDWTTWDPGIKHIEEAKTEGWIFFPKKRGENEEGNVADQ